MQYAAAHQFSGLIDEHRFPEAEQAVHARLSLEPRNADALVAGVDLILAQNQEERLGDAGRLADQCVAANPANSECQEARGDVLGAQVARGGIGSVLVNAGAIREAYRKAIELDPQNFRAAVALLRFYLQAPIFVGGSSGRARELASQTGRVNPDVSNLMQAFCDADDGKLSHAEALALSVNLAGAESLLGSQRELMYIISQRYLEQKQFGDSIRVADALRKRFPMSELGYLGLGMAAQAQGRHAEAITLFDSALAVAPRALIHYRIALSALAQNDKAGAALALEKALAGKPGLARHERADAAQRLAALGGH
jgi:tetratricopeptide (TPR) repeat protein